MYSLSIYLQPCLFSIYSKFDKTIFLVAPTAAAHAGAGKTHTMMGSERVVGTRAGDTAEVSGIVPQSLVELFRLLDERAEAGGGEEDETESWKVRVGYLQVIFVFLFCFVLLFFKLCVCVIICCDVVYHSTAVRCLRDVMEW